MPPPVCPAQGRVAVDGDDQVAALSRLPRVGQRSINQQRPPDVLEAFNLGQDLAPDHPGMIAWKPLHGPNQWPSLPGFKEAIVAWQGHMTGLMHTILRAMSGALGISHEIIAPWFEQPLCQMRPLHYPPQPPEVGHMTGARPHQDTSFMTILLQDDRGGLEVEARDGEWLQAPQRPDTLVVNVGEYLELLTSAGRGPFERISDFGDRAIAKRPRGCNIPVRRSR